MPKLARNALDFAGPVSLALGMEDVTREQIRTAFADLTVLAEDVACLAAEGQSPELGATEALQLARSIEPRLRRGWACLQAVLALAAD